MRSIQAGLVAIVILLAGCAGVAPKPKPIACPQPKVCPATAATAPPAFSRRLQAANWADLPGWAEDDVNAAWPAFLLSCRGMAGKSYAPAWRRVCDLAATESKQPGFDARRFFEAHLQPYAVLDADGAAEGRITGYYEPLLRGSRTRRPGFEQPVYGVPDDLLTIDLSEVFPDLKDRRLRGRLVGNKVLPYWSRAEIEARADHLPARTLLYVDDPVELFFLQVQGSGRVQLRDGSLVRLNYADQNGRRYESIGRWLVEHDELPLAQASMQGIQAWARANPNRLDELLNVNPSYVFFREAPNSKDGPIGALGVPLTPKRSIAVDPRSVPLGTPVFLATTRPNSPQPMNRLVLAQDTGGAIKGAVRADFFWGFGKAAGELAGSMKQDGRLWLLLPPEAAPKEGIDAPNMGVDR